VCRIHEALKGERREILLSARVLAFPRVSDDVVQSRGLEGAPLIGVIVFTHFLCVSSVSSDVVGRCIGRALSGAPTGASSSPKRTKDSHGNRES
jgi:hypothetical protein